eukprot:SAG31_NODE_7449_length_1686_cov_1.666667_2_plen_113_part_00
MSQYELRCLLNIHGPVQEKKKRDKRAAAGMTDPIEDEALEEALAATTINFVAVSIIRIPVFTRQYFVGPKKRLEQTRFQEAQATQLSALLDHLYLQTGDPRFDDASVALTKR